MESVSGFFDLCVNEFAVTGNYEGTIKTLFNHGYRTIAINYELDEEEQEENKVPGKKKRKGEKPEKPIFPTIRPITPVKGCESMTILLRLTVHLATKEFYARISKMPDFKKFHIIAILPLNQAIYSITGELEADILTVKAHTRSDYKIFRKNYNVLLAHGYYMELHYAAIMNESTRRIVITNAHALHVSGKSRNVIISSGINCAAHIRSPYDIINLGLIFGLNQAQSKMAIMQNCRNVYFHAVSRRYGKIAMIAKSGTRTIDREECAKPDVSVIELDDDDDEGVSDVGHQLKKIKT